MKQIDCEWKEKTLAQFALCKDAAREIDEFLKNSPEVNHGRYLHELWIPKIYSNKDVARFAWIVEMSDRICGKLIDAYLTDPDYRALFPFSKELEELILTDRGYTSRLPMARYDIFYNEETGGFKFCEINTDGTSAMNEDAICCETLGFHPVYAELKEKYDFESFELFDSWVNAFADVYGTYAKKKEKPYIAIVDFMEEACSYEFTIFRDRFIAAGYETEICEIRDLTFDGADLIAPSGRVIDAIYRRAVTGDIERHWEETKAFRDAVKAGAVCVIGALCTQVVHHKLIFKIMHDPASLRYLTEEEQQFVKDHVPATFDLTEEVCGHYGIFDNKDAWIIKPYDSYGSRGVCAGVDVTQEEWENELKEHFDDGFIVQEYCTPYQTENCYLPQEDVFRMYNNMPGLFAYNGRFAGIYSRLSDGGIISSQTNKKVAPALLIKDGETKGE